MRITGYEPAWLDDMCLAGRLAWARLTTQNPIDAIANLLRGSAGDDVTIVDTGHQRPRDLTLEVPASPLEAVMSAEVRQQVYDQLVGLIEAHHTTLVFVNTRRMADASHASCPTAWGRPLSPHITAAWRRNSVYPDFRYSPSSLGILPGGGAGREPKSGEQWGGDLLNPSAVPTKWLAKRRPAAKASRHVFAPQDSP